MKLFLALVILTAGTFSLGSCAWEESICSDGEVMVKRSESDFGGHCEKRKSDDRECPDDEILRRIEDTGREDCIRDLVGHERDGLESQGPE